MGLKFLIQSIDYDFCYELINAIKYQKWADNNDIDYELYKDSDALQFWYCSHDYIPCGSVEFVTAYMKQCGLPIPKPRNVPDSLFWNAGRHILNIQEDFVIDNAYNDYFVKSNDMIKEVCGISKDLGVVKKGWYQISNQVDIKSEWRCFVYKGRLVGLQNYQGAFDLFPNITKIKKMIELFKEQPIAFTLDVFIDENNETYCLEVHDFFSCGLYGFRDYTILPFMFSNWWNEYKNISRIEWIY